MNILVVMVCLVMGSTGNPYPGNPAQHSTDGDPVPATDDHQHETSAPTPHPARPKEKKASDLITIQAGHIKVSLDQATIETLTEMFNRLDRDGDGFVSIDEHKAMWNSLDTDGDGVLSTEEISTGRVTWYEVVAGDINGDGIMSERDAEHLAKGMDLNGDGRNGLDEILVFIGL